MNKKSLITISGIAALSLGAISISFAKSTFNNALGSDAEYQITLDESNAPKSSEYSKVVKTAQGNDFTVNYTGTHTLTTSYHTVLGSGAYIWNSSKPISHLQSIIVDIDGGSLKVSGGQASNNLYEVYNLTDDGTINFTDDVNYFKVEATSQTKVVKLVLKYTDDCLTGATESAKSISLEGVPSTLEVGKNAVVVPSTNSNGTLEVVSSDPTVANITKTTGKSGTTYKVNALKEGTCKIYATTSNGLKSSETTLKVISVGLPANTVGRTYRATSENEYFKYGYITVYSATSIKYEYEGYSTTGTFYETEDNARIFYMEDETSYLEITPSSDGSSLGVFGDIYDDSFTLLNTYGNTHTNNPTTFAKYIKATSLSLNKTSTTLEIGEKETLTATVSSNATNAKLEWSSSDTSVVTVDNSNTKSKDITAVAAGTATITVTELDSGLTATCEVTVNSPVSVTDFTITGENTIKVGQTTTLSVTVSPSGAKYSTLTWVSKNSDVASVNSSGVVTGLKAGTATIEATIDGSLTKSFVVTVEADSDPIPVTLQGTYLNSENDLYMYIYSDSMTLYIDDLYEESFAFVSSSGNKYFFENDITVEVGSSHLFVSGLYDYDNFTESTWIYEEELTFDRI